MSQANSQFWFQRIFHPTDFSDASNIAFVHALKLAVLANARLTILHAGADGDDWQDCPGVRRTLDRWEMAPPNSPKEAIFSVGLDVQKIATPLARRSGEMTLFIPHSSEGFVSLESGAVSLRNVIIPVDHSPDPQIAVDGAVSFANALGSHKVTFTLLHVGEEDRFPEVVMPEREMWKWRKICKQGDVKREILQATHECRADLIVMPTRGHHGFLDALRGSATERIVRNSTCPVLTIPAYGAHQQALPAFPCAAAFLFSLEFCGLWRSPRIEKVFPIAAP